MIDARLQRECRPHLPRRDTPTSSTWGWLASRGVSAGQLNLRRVSFQTGHLLATHRHQPGVQVSRPLARFDILKVERGLLFRRACGASVKSACRDDAATAVASGWASQRAVAAAPTPSADQRVALPADRGGKVTGSRALPQPGAPMTNAGSRHKARRRRWIASAISVEDEPYQRGARPGAPPSEWPRWGAIKACAASGLDVAQFSHGDQPSTPRSQCVRLAAS
jgi:hypothetical protein